MKYFFAMWFAVLFAVSDVMAEPSPFDGRHTIKPIVYTECQAGHVFVIAASANGVSVMQVFQDAGDMVPKPIECGNKDSGETEFD